MSRARSRSGSDTMRRGISLFLQGVEECAGRDGARVRVRSAAAQVASAWRDDLLAGYRTDPSRLLTPLRAGHAEDVVAVCGLEFASVCRHHLLPFQGLVHLAYAPAGRITGLSRLSRLVDCLSRRLQLQESLTREIAEEIQRQLRPEGASCVIEATHACMTMRGDRRRGRIVTAAFTGSFRRSSARRREVMALLMPKEGKKRKAHRGSRVSVSR